MGRKNRKGRTSSQNPRRFHRTGRKSRDGRGQDGLASDRHATRDPAAPDPDWMPYPELDYRRPRPDAIPADRQRPGARVTGANDFDGSEPMINAVVMLCGRCTEWISRHRSLGFDERGECLHPASGISYPPVNMEACPYFH